MNVDCPTCGYTFETATGLQCPRCGDAISCSSVGCSECDACSSPLSMIGTRIASKVNPTRIDRADDTDD